MAKVPSIYRGRRGRSVMVKRVLIIQGHPDAGGGHLCHALADAYADGARGAGHQVERIDVGRLDFPLLRTQGDFLEGKVPASLAFAQAALTAADHVVIVFPLWLGAMPAVLKGFLEQVLRPGFAFAYGENGSGPAPLLKGRTGRIVVTMGMPSLFFRLWFLSAGAMVLKRNILQFVGISPTRLSVLGNVEGAGEAQHAAWLAQMRALGREAD